MSHYNKCFTKCVKTCDKNCKGSGHTNKHCHLKKFSCCYEHEPCKMVEKEASSPEPKFCPVCCCLLKNCSCRRKNADEEYNTRKPQRSGNICKCCDKKAAEPNLCPVCCCALSNCMCQETRGEEGAYDNRRPRTLSLDLPLYDEKSHLIGYIKRGAVIDDPSCGKSRDRILEEGSSTEASFQPPFSRAPGCMASCRYAEGVRRDNLSTAVPRWTTRSAFDNATRAVSPQKRERRQCVCRK